MPATPWAWQQAWVDLAFIHFEADGEELRRHLPPGLELELFDGKAWIGIVPFRMEGVTKRGWPAPRVFSDFPEINVRTYVTAGGKPGVWFFSLWATSRLAVWVARTFFRLPYYYATIAVAGTQEQCRYAARRGTREFVAHYRPGKAAPSQPGGFAHWATERYCLYCASADGRCYRGEIQHPKWPLQGATVDILHNTLVDGLLGPMHPEVYFARRIEVVLWPLEPLGPA
jgi:uncharacterized protein YqjF (DUF2071 family)